MAVPTFPTLTASTLVRKWVIEVNTGTVASPIWKMIGAVNNNQFNPDSPNLEDDSDMQSGGAGSQTKTAGNASAQLTILRKVKSDGVSYDDAQEFVKGKSINVYGTANTVQLRISEFTPGGGPRVDAYMGFFAVGWEYQGGGNTALDTVQLTFSGQGACAAITHPYPNTAVVPAITAAVPGGSGSGTIAVAGGVLVHIYGSSFTGVTGASGVTFGGTNATNYSVESDSLIIATAPAKTAGSVNLVVTNGTGASPTFPVTYA